MTEVVNCGGGTAHGEGTIDVTSGCPLPTYIKEGEEEVRPAQGVRLEESYSHRE